MELTPEQVRVLGALFEKQATTPDNYPLSTNALVAACNQTTSRDPVMALAEREVDQTVLSLRELGLARTVRGEGQRVHKHKHVLDEAWGLSRTELAVLSVLALRGAQTAAELRQRAERYGSGLDHAGVEAVLARLAGGDEPFVRQLPRRPGEREARWVHLLSGEPSEVPAPLVVRPDERPAAAPTAAASTGAPAASAGALGGSGRAAEVAELRAEVEALRDEVAALRREVEELRAEVEALRAAFGV